MTFQGTRFAIVALLFTAISVGAQSSKTAPAPKSKSRLARAIDQTLEKGHDAVLPPTVSDLLGISPQRKEVPVKQAFKMGEPLRGFDISIEQHNNVVIWVESRLQNETTYYLTSRSGALRRVLSVQEGTGHPRLPTKHDRETFESEKKRWLDELVPKTPS